MNKRQKAKETKTTLSTDTHSLPILAKSLLIGVLSGVVVSLYRLVLELAEDTALSVYHYISDNPQWILPMFVTLAAIGYLVGLVIKKEPMSAGSGVPQVKALMTGHVSYSWWRVLIAKFFGSSLSTLGGLALGREGPCVQLGGCVGQGVGEKFGRNPGEKKVLIASGAGAGMGAALNAPLAGVLFAFEEIFKYFSPLILLSTMTAAISAQFVCRSVFGIEPLLHFASLTALPLSANWLTVVFGVLLGVIGVFYDFVLLYVRRLYIKIRILVPAIRPIVPFLLAGIIGLVLPVALGSGHRTIEILDLAMPIGFLLMLLVVKFFFIILCLGSNAPGGDLFPLLVLGAMMGAFFGNFAVNYLGLAPEFFATFVILGMAGFFAAIVGAPMTAIVLLVELTGSFTQMLSLTLVCLVSYTVISLLKKLPFYIKVQEAFNSETSYAPLHSSKYQEKVNLEVIVHHGAKADGMLIKELDLPEQTLITEIKRGEQSIIPKGDTRILAEDYLIVLTDGAHEAMANDILAELAECHACK